MKEIFEKNLNSRISRYEKQKLFCFRLKNSNDDQLEVFIKKNNVIVVN